MLLRKERLMSVRSILFAVVACGLLCGLAAGCSLGVMMGKMLTGDPMVTSQFQQMTGQNLSKGKHKIVVVCRTPDSVSRDQSTLAIDLVDGITRRMRVHGIDVVDPDDVATWVDDNGGPPDSAQEIAAAFDVDYIAWIDVEQYSLLEESSPDLLRGRASGLVRAFQVQEIGGDRSALAAFTTEFSIEFPPLQPISQTTRSKLSFQKEFMDRICEQLSSRFYDHRPGLDL
jgi:hypothetical protein